MSRRLAAAIVTAAVFMTACGAGAEDPPAEFEAEVGATTPTPTASPTTAAPSASTTGPPATTAAPVVAETTTTTTSSAPTPGPPDPGSFDPPFFTEDDRANALAVGDRWESASDPYAITLLGVNEVGWEEIRRGRPDFRYVELTVLHENQNPDFAQVLRNIAPFQWIHPGGWVSNLSTESCSDDINRTEPGETVEYVVCLALPADLANEGWLLSSPFTSHGVWNVSGALPAAERPEPAIIDCGLYGSELREVRAYALTTIQSLFTDQFGLDPTIDVADMNEAAFEMHQLVLRMERLGDTESAELTGYAAGLTPVVEEGRSAAVTSAGALADTSLSIDEIVDTVIAAWTGVLEGFNGLGDVPNC